MAFRSHHGFRPGLAVVPPVVIVRGRGVVMSTAVQVHSVVIVGNGEVVDTVIISVLLNINVLLRLLLLWTKAKHARVVPATAALVEAVIAVGSPPKEVVPAVRVDDCPGCRGVYDSMAA